MRKALLYVGREEGCRLDCGSWVTVVANCEVEGEKELVLEMAACGGPACGTSQPVNERENLLIH